MRYTKISMLLDEINNTRKLLNKKRIMLKDVGFAICWCRKFYKDTLDIKYCRNILDILKFGTNKSLSDDSKLNTYIYLYSNYRSNYHALMLSDTFKNNAKTFISRLNGGLLKLEHHIPALNWCFFYYNNKPISFY